MHGIMTVVFIMSKDIQVADLYIQAIITAHFLGSLSG
jgi:hypothetical protein